MLCLTHLSSVVLLTLINGVVVKNCPPELNDLDVNPPVLVVEYGESVIARCRSYSNHKELSWNVTSGNLTYLTDHMVFWETESLTDWEIQPVCYMILDDVQCNKPLSLTLYKLPDRVSISAMNHTGPMVEGSEYKLRCDIHNAAPLHLLTVSWYKGFDLIKSVSFSDSAQKNPSTLSTTLYVLPSKEDDGVFYRCEATLNLEPQRSSPTVTSDPVIFTVTPQSNNCSDLMLDPPEVVVQYGEPVSVSCRSLSNHTDLRWSVPIGNVSQTENQTVTWNADNLTDWEIQPVCYKSPDEVECRKALPLIVYKMPDKVTISVTDHSGPMTAGKKYDLQCDIENFAPVHVLAVSWYKGDTLIRNRGFSELPTKTLSNKTVTFKITADKHDHDSEYRCEAKLKLGARGPQPSPVMSSNSLSVPVHYAPEFHCPANYTGLEHKSFSDQCLVMASPVARIIWEKDGEVVKPLHQLLREDSGSYVITATNEHGVKQHSLTVNVWYGPEIWINVSSVEVKEGEKVSLNCSAMGLPEPEASWSFQNSTVGHQTLVIPKASLADAGEYTCTATNELGSSKETVTLTVESNCPMTIEPPKLVVEFNASATAVCSTTSTIYGMGWEAFMGAVRMKDVQSIAWRVENVDYWGTEPICYIIGSELCTLRLPVTVYKRPDNVSISTGNHTGPMVKGGRYELECAVRNVAPVNRLHVKWYKQQQLVQTNSFSDENKYPADKRVTLQISPQSGDDGVQYKCEAEMELGPEGPQPPPRVTSEPLSLTVHYKPEITCSDWSPMINTSLSSYPYEVSGNPSFRITWYRDQSPVSSDLRLGRNDSGLYEIVAANKMGISSCKTNITVEYGPEIQQGNSSMAVQSGRDVSLNCTAMGNPAPHMTWSFQHQTKATGWRHTTLSISKTQSADAGEYTCSATNKLGSRTITVSLAVRETNIRTIIICLGLSLIVLIIISYLIYKCTERRRSGKYTVQTSWDVVMTLLENE